MQNRTLPSKQTYNMSDWISIREAIKLSNEKTNTKITDSDIYRHALYGDIYLSIYFQSPIILRKIQMLNKKLKVRPIKKSFNNPINLINRNNLTCSKSFILSTEGDYIATNQRIIDTTLAGFEYVVIQRFLALSLNIPQPKIGACEFNFGISVTLSGELYQIFERDKNPAEKMDYSRQKAKEMSENTNEVCVPLEINRDIQENYLPLYDLPQDACFVIKYTELEKLINLMIKKKHLFRLHPEYQRHYPACSGLHVKITK
ncbi:TPA: hypothetical protein ACPZQF_002974 [Yersinia enterocolitica]